MLDRYGEAIEADLHRHFGLDILSFYDGTYCAEKLVNLVSWLDRERTSYLSYAQATDVEAYREHMKATGGKQGPKRKPAPPELFEWTWEHEALAALFSLIQQHIHVSTGSKKKPQIKSWPGPRTAAQLWAREESKRKHDHIESMIRFSDEPPKE